MSGNIRSFRDLRVWQKAMDLATDVYGEIKRFPTHERFSLEEQIRRSSRSVPDNVAEAWRKRRYPAAFVSKLNDAEDSAGDTQSQLELCFLCGYLDESSAKRLDEAYGEVLSMLVTMAAHPDKWRIRESRRNGDIETRRHGDAETRR